MLTVNCWNSPGKRFKNILSTEVHKTSSHKGNISCTIKIEKFPHCINNNDIRGIITASERKRQTFSLYNIT